MTSVFGTHLVFLCVITNVDRYLTLRIHWLFGCPFTLNIHRYFQATIIFTPKIYVLMYLWKYHVVPLCNFVIIYMFYFYTNIIQVHLVHYLYRMYWTCAYTHADTQKAPWSHTGAMSCLAPEVGRSTGQGRWIPSNLGSWERQVQVSGWMIRGMAHDFDADGCSLGSSFQFLFPKRIG